MVYSILCLPVNIGTHKRYIYRLYVHIYIYIYIYICVLYIYLIIYTKVYFGIYNVYITMSSGDSIYTITCYIIYLIINLYQLN